MENSLSSNPSNEVTIAQNGIEALLKRRPIILQLLRFGAIGVLNTSLDFIILNFVSKGLGISSGYALGTVNIPGFVLAVIQSYLWNRAWAFEAQQDTAVLKNFGRLVMVGGLGVLALILVLFAAGGSSGPLIYLGILAAFIVVQILLWLSFGLKLNQTQGNTQLIVFILVSLVGLVINSLLLSYISTYAIAHSFFASRPDLIKNIAKIVATLASLIWNFIGYKLFVFRK